MAPLFTKKKGFSVTIVFFFWVCALGLLLVAAVIKMVKGVQHWTSQLVTHCNTLQCGALMGMGSFNNYIVFF